MNEQVRIGRSLLAAALLIGFCIQPVSASGGHGNDDKHGHDEGHGNGPDKTVTVDCAKGQSIAHALQTGRAPRATLTILIKGVCHENVLITSDDVTLRGITPDAGISGLNPVDDNTVHVRGASRVYLESLAITNGRHGIAGVEGSAVTVTGSHIHGNANSGVVYSRRANGTVDACLVENNGRRGVVAIDGSYATLTNSTVRGSGTRGVEVEGGSHMRIGLTKRGELGPNSITGNAEEGIEVANGSNAYIYANTVTGNGQDGIALYQATARLLGQNLVEGNARHGVLVNDGSTLFQGQGEFVGAPNHDTIRGNAVDGIRAFNGSSLDIRDATVADNAGNGVRVDLHSSMRIYNTTISGNGAFGIELLRDSGMLAQNNVAPVTVSGHAVGVQCADAESSVAGFGNLGPDPVNCSGF